MSVKNIVSIILLVLSFLILNAEPLMAGPGGKIARAMFETFWGKVLFVILMIILSPLIIYSYVKEKRAERRTRKDLAYVSKYDQNFEWLNIKQRVLDCFYRIHMNWSNEDVSEASEYMSTWYWQNQQMVYLDRWKREGLKNHCDLKTVRMVKPLLFVHTNHGKEHEGSLLVVSIKAHMKDYLEDRNTGKVVEGSKKYKDVETIWSFTIIEGKWRVSNIEEGSHALEYARMVSELPRIEETILLSEGKTSSV